MNEITFSYDPFPSGHVFIHWDEVEKGLRRMHIIENYDDLREEFKLRGLAPWISNRENYQTIDSFSESDIEGAITHETLHCVVFELEDQETSSRLNVLDSAFGLRDELRGLHRKVKR